MSNEEINDECDEDISKQHSELLKSVAELDHNFLKIKIPERSELTSEISEFHLPRDGIADEDPIRIDNLVRTLRGKKQCLKLGEQYKATKKRAKVLSKPLEKPAEEKLKREVCFENNSEYLKKWNAVVTKNRVADHLVFPINKLPSSKLQKSGKVGYNRVQSDLEKEYAALEPEKETEDDEDKLDKFAMTKEEMIQRAKENAKFRAQQSYKAEKAHRRNKIKSKKFHKIEKRAKIKQQFEEFDKLQKDNPEIALQKLEQLDKARAEERMSLKHKNTGQWARNKQVRAKYDKESRQVLAQQLSISRELTQKIRKDDSEEDEDENLETHFIRTASGSLEYNPWVNNEIKIPQTEENLVEEKQRKICGEEDEISRNLVKKSIQLSKLKTSSFSNPVEQVTIEYLNDKSPEDTNGSGKKRKIKELKCAKVSKVEKVKDKDLEKTDKPTDNSGTSKWLVEVCDDLNESTHSTSSKLPKISEIFETMESKSKQKVSKKLKMLKRKLKSKSVSKTKKMKTNLDDKNSDLSFKTKANRPVIDEALNEKSSGYDDQSNEEVKSTEVQSEQRELNPASKKPLTEIDPNNFINAKSKHLNLKTRLPDASGNEGDVLDDSDEEEQEEIRQNIISEAFVDDDVVNEFKNEKEAEQKKSQVTHLETNLPGWGSWADKNYKTSQRKKRRFITDFNDKTPRKDKAKENLILLDDSHASIKQHQVNDLPHPFMTVTDFEASIRAPIGRNFVPEITHRQLIKPPIKTRMGTIIEPMDEDILLKKKSSTTQNEIKL
ncbi:U3 small nucleolar RNA-associated protein 14 homolog A [Microplitis demolitor]|uniref:U3 small nucleolar RNA-associated protein 14 homolog A n=1 Tax=Microplitis demolitor TaxID=69319 RepID=UPI0004CCE2FD|nr:U3 small nucleolar RNA-associated protein 14 homolog A [Microplitis demolitor]